MSERETGHLDSLDSSICTFKGRHNLGAIYADSGRLAEAEREFGIALNHNPTFAPSLAALGEVYVRMRRFDDARATSARLAAVDAAQAQALLARISAGQRSL